MPAWPTNCSMRASSSEASMRPLSALTTAISKTTPLRSGGAGSSSDGSRAAAAAMAAVAIRAWPSWSGLKDPGITTASEMGTSVHAWYAGRWALCMSRAPAARRSGGCRPKKGCAERFPWGSGVQGSELAPSGTKSTRSASPSSSLSTGLRREATSTGLQTSPSSPSCPWRWSSQPVPSVRRAPPAERPALAVVSSTACSRSRMARLPTSSSSWARERRPLARLREYTASEVSVHAATKARCSPRLAREEATDATQPMPMVPGATRRTTSSEVSADRPDWSSAARRCAAWARATAVSAAQ
mmetsp:Transcript_3079/g.10125  ORF Transcript_3079/g.10125 Transcript_3079/m.10125 type:complete len:300 (-) Transcript_3079:414-1313(-)